ncbi:MAG: hypothetical protein ACJARI_003707 [Bacteroidia bacterium]|jgi:hypothetical protein
MLQVAQQFLRTCFGAETARAIFDIGYEDVQWVATGEWLPRET